MSKEQGMISPFEEKQIRGDSISYGLSSFGYDARVSDEFKIFTNVNSEIVDPKNFKPTNFVTKNSSECIIPCLLYTSPSPRDGLLSRMPSSA